MKSQLWVKHRKGVPVILFPKVYWPIKQVCSGSATLPHRVNQSKFQPIFRILSPCTMFAIISGLSDRPTLLRSNDYVRERVMIIIAS